MLRTPILRVEEPLLPDPQGGLRPESYTPPSVLYR